jgi:Serine/threonine protein kinase involved in cell cycle control
MDFYIKDRNKADRKERKTEVEKTESGVFDKRTLLTLSKLISNGTIEIVDFPIASGKESFVFRGESKRGLIAIKIYPISTSIFRNMPRYIDGDPRFKKVKKDTRSIVCAWAKKEYRNLREMKNAGARVPEPIAVKNNVLVMEYLGSRTRPAPLLKDRNMSRDEACRIYEKIIGYVKKIYYSGLIHGDLSEYNVLMWRGPVLIDVGQGVSIKHPLAAELLRRDVETIVRFFNRFGVNIDIEKTMEEVTHE